MRRLKFHNKYVYLRIKTNITTLIYFEINSQFFSPSNGIMELAFHMLIYNKMKIG